MSQIAEFLRARYGEAMDRQRRIFRSTWEPDIPCPTCERPTEEMRTYGGSFGPLASFEPCRHEIHDPAVMRQFEEPAPDLVAIADLDAKIALVDEFEPADGPCVPETDAQLHARFAHPAWEYRTTSGPRKQWDDVDVPPRDEEGEPEPGWERNLDAGRDGWERWDHTEDSYWRRPRPDGTRPPHIPRGLRILARPFAGHPDHKGEEWAP